MKDHEQYIITYRMAQKLLILLLLLLWLANPAWGEDEDLVFPSTVLDEGSEQGATVQRSPRPTSKIAENVTVITAKQIEELNAHTVAEVLNTVPGIQFNHAGRTPGMTDFFSIQGASNTHILVMLDGISQNSLGNNYADLGHIPVQHIERIEIIKGGASAVWGQALGGVVNIVTKAPNPDQPFSGSTFTSIGDRFTTDLRAEATGTIDRFGYYLTGGQLHSDGLLSNNGINQADFFGKFVYDLPVKGRLTFSMSSINSQRGFEEVPPPDDWHDNGSNRVSSSRLLFTYPLAQRLNLELVTHYSYTKDDTRWGYMTSSDLFQHFFVKETTWSSTGKLIWGDSRLNLTTGLDYEHNQTDNSQTVDPPTHFNKSFNRNAVFANGTLSLGELSILPGIRYDRVDADHNEVSYTLGATYRLTEKSVMRAYFARGYSHSVAVLNNAPPQKGWTVQTGIETGEISYVWLKGTLFYNDTWAMETITSDAITTSSQIRQGIEIEARTVPLYGFSLAAGYTLTDLRDKESRIRVEQTPGDLVKLAITYDNPSWGIHGILNGNYVWWNSPSNLTPEDRNFLWDLHLTQKLLPGKELSPELFLTVHNIFNSAQYQDYHYLNAGRWLEGGVRCKF